MQARLTLAGLLCLLIPSLLSAQLRDFRTQQLILDDNGAAGGMNTMTLQVDPTLTTDVVVMIPAPASSPAQFLLVPAGSPGAWLLNGNAGTTAGIDFLGTTDAQALHLYVNGGTDNSLILNTNGIIQRDAGGDPRGTNAVDLQRTRSAPTEVASGADATIGGGTSNTASFPWTTVGGGTSNQATRAYATIAGGDRNTASGVRSTVAGGQSSTASGTNSTIGGGARHIASGQFTAIAGGDRNVAAGDYSAIPGGRGLTLGAGSFGFLGGNTGANDMTVADPNTALFGNTNLWLANNNNAASELRFYEANADTGAFPGTTNYTSFAAGAQSVDINYVLPTDAPTAGQVLHSDASGNLNWAAAGTSGLVYTRVTTSDTVYNAAATVGIIGVNVTLNAVQINLPPASDLASGCVMIINVEEGDAVTNNVTIMADTNASGVRNTFDGTSDTTLTIGFDKGQFKLYSDGVDTWYIY